MSAATAPRVALVTGANRGIGQAIARALVNTPGWVVLIGSRSGKGSIHDYESNGPAGNLKRPDSLTEEELKRDGVPVKVDIDDVKSLSDAAALIKAKYGGLDALINNAGIAFKGDEFDENVARTTIETNYYGTKRACDAFLPLLKDGARVVNVSSLAGYVFLGKMSDALRARFLAADLTEAQLDALLTAFIGDVADGTYAQKGWPKSAYGVSKAGMTAYTVLSARTYAERADAKKGVLINACCPGYVNTLLSSNKGPLTPDQGAVTPVKLALLPAGDTTTGKFWSKEQVHPLA